MSETLIPNLEATFLSRFRAAVGLIGSTLPRLRSAGRGGLPVRETLVFTFAIIVNFFLFAGHFQDLTSSIIDTVVQDR